MGSCRSYDAKICSLLSWFLVLPTLVYTDNTVQCNNVVIPNGSVFRTEDTAFNNTLVVQCHQGYYLHPTDSALLNCTGSLVSSPLPECRRKQDCSLSCTVQNGKCNPANKDQFKPGETVMTVCETGYKVNTSYNTQRCQPNGTWTPTLQPICVLKGKSCSISKSEVIEYYLDTSLAEASVLHNTHIQVACKKGYTYSGKKGYSSQSVNITCYHGQFDKPLNTLCVFVGVDIQLSYTYTKNDKSFSNTSNGDIVTFNKGENITLICKVFSRTDDGLPYPEVTWLYPGRLRDFVERRHGANFEHTDYIESLTQNYSISVSTAEDTHRHYAQGTLRISPTMEVHTGEYTCQVKLVNYLASKAVPVKIKADFVIAMYFLLIIPVVLFVIVHCFYRKATLSPFPTPNKLTKDMMQEVDKKKKLEEMKANPAYQHIQPMGEGNRNNARGRRGAVVDL